VHRKGIIKPEKTKHGLEQGVVGEETSCQGERLKTANASHNPINGPISNPKYNPINNPKYRKRKQDECRTAHVLELSKPEYKGGKSFAVLVAKTKADSIVLAIRSFELIIRIHSNYTRLYSCISLKLGDRTISFYIFYTAGDAFINGTEWAEFL
jgi:hypothetical protein